MDQDLSTIKPLVYKSQINVPYNWWAGETASKFFSALGDKKELLATKCDECGKVFIPPKKTCPVCFTENETWVTLAPVGELVTYTIVRKQLPALPQKAPVIFGLVKLDGADTALLHMINEIDPEKVKIGMRLKAKFAKDKKGTILDIDYFVPA